MMSAHPIATVTKRQQSSQISSRRSYASEYFIWTAHFTPGDRP